jgi:hypothetical protein
MNPESKTARHAQIATVKSSRLNIAVIIATAVPISAV